MYDVINLLQWGVLIVGALIIHKRGKNKVRGAIILILVTVIIGAVIQKANVSVLFDTPADAARYLSAGKITVTIDGQDSCCIITTEDETQYITRFLEKVDNKYRILDMSEVTVGSTVADDEMPVSLYSVDGTTDRYAVGTFIEPAGSKIQIKDTNGTVFSTTTIGSSPSDNTVFGYARIDQFDDDYGVHVTYAP